METPFLLINPKTSTSIPIIKPITSLAHNKKPNSPKSTTTTHISHNVSLQEAISALGNGSQIRPKTFISLLQSCIDSDSIADGRRLHSSVDLLTEPNPFVETKLVSMYAKCGSLEEARKVFDGMRERNLYTWSAMIGAYSRDQKWEQVVELFFKMMQEGVAPDGFLLPKISQACSNIGDVETGRLVHSIAVRGGLLNSSEEAHVSNSLLAMYAKCGELELAKRFFEKLEARGRVSWNSIISGHCQYGENEEALRLFEQMVEEKVEPGLVTWNILIASYNQCGNPERAMELMEHMKRAGTPPDVVTWTSMISGSVQNNKPSQALDLYRDMISSEADRNAMTIASVISACADLRSSKKGREIHSHAVKLGVMANMLVLNALVDMYAKCGRLEDAERLFDAIQEKDVYTWNSMIGGYTLAGCYGKANEFFSKMETSGVRRNVVTWNVMMSGYIQNGDDDQAMELFQSMERDGIKRTTASWNTLISGSLQNGHVDKALSRFRQMQSNLVKPNSITVLSILPAFANLVSTWKIKEIHASILHNGLQSETSIANALISTYASAGEIGVAYTVFQRLQSKDLITWNSMISGFVLHGSSHLARDLFARMKEQGLKPNQATLTSMIRAYGIDWMVKEGSDLFYGMSEEYQISPSLDQYIAMVELFGRAGRLGEASELIENMPIEPDSAVWNALLIAATVHGNAKIASLATKELLRLDPNKTRSCASHDCCWIEVAKTIHTFSTGEKPSVELEKLRAELVIEESEEDGEFHCEKLALAFGMINKSSSRSVRIVKSIRMCTKCHTIAKQASKVYECEILLKDPASLHVFKDGKCSCRDYW